MQGSFKTINRKNSAMLVRGSVWVWVEPRQRESPIYSVGGHWGRTVEEVSSSISSET